MKNGFFYWFLEDFIKLRLQIKEKQEKVDVAREGIEGGGKSGSKRFDEDGFKMSSHHNCVNCFGFPVNF